MAQVSDCCGARVTVQGGVTRWWRCTQCSNPCSAVVADYEPRHSHRPARCMGCESDIWPLPNAKRHDDGSMVYEDGDGMTVCQKAEHVSAGEPMNYMFHRPLPEKI